VGSLDMLRMWDALHFTEMGRVTSPFARGYATEGCWFCRVCQCIPLNDSARKNMTMNDETAAERKAPYGRIAAPEIDAVQT
jgi:hypothetical protein